MFSSFLDTSKPFVHSVRVYAAHSLAVRCPLCAPWFWLTLYLGYGYPLVILYVHQLTVSSMQTSFTIMRSGLLSINLRNIFSANGMRFLWSTAYFIVNRYRSNWLCLLCQNFFVPKLRYCRSISTASFPA